MAASWSREGLSWTWAEKQMSGLEGKVGSEPWRGHRAVHMGTRPVGTGTGAAQVRCSASKSRPSALQPRAKHLDVPGFCPSSCQLRDPQIRLTHTVWGRVCRAQPLGKTHLPLPNALIQLRGPAWTREGAAGGEGMTWGWGAERWLQSSLSPSPRCQRHSCGDRYPRAPASS